MVVAAVADAVGVPERIGEADATPWSPCSATVPRSVVVDNCEHLLDGARACVSDLLTTCPSVRGARNEPGPSAAARRARLPGPRAVHRRRRRTRRCRRVVPRPIGRRRPAPRRMASWGRRRASTSGDMQPYGCMIERDVWYEVDGLTMVGRLAVPDEAVDGPRPAVLIAHEANGLDPVQRARAAELAELGYVGFALDYHGGGEPPPFADAEVRTSGLVGRPRSQRTSAEAGSTSCTMQPTVDRTKVAPSATASAARWCSSSPAGGAVEGGRGLPSGAPNVTAGGLPPHHGSRANLRRRRRSVRHARGSDRFRTRDARRPAWTGACTSTAGFSTRSRIRTLPTRVCRASCTTSRRPSGPGERCWTCSTRSSPEVPTQRTVTVEELDRVRVGRTEREHGGCSSTECDSAIPGAQRWAVTGRSVGVRRRVTACRLSSVTYRHIPDREARDGVFMDAANSDITRARPAGGRERHLSGAAGTSQAAGYRGRGFGCH